MESRCLISGEVSGSLIKRFQDMDDVFKKVWIYVVHIMEFISVKQDLMSDRRASLTDWSIGSLVFHLVSTACFSDLSSAFCNLKLKKEIVGWLDVV